MLLSFKNYLLLTEDRLNFLKNKYKNLTNWEVGGELYNGNELINFWYDKDPTSNHKYADWILRQYSKHDFRMEDDARVHDALENFERYKFRLTQKDINHYHHLSDLEDAIEVVNGAKSKREEVKAVKNDGADKIFDRGGVVVYHIKTEAAAKFYGKGTKWCTAADKNCKFDSYNKRGPLYVVFCKDLEGKPAKYQFHFESKQFADEKDRNIDLAELVKKNPELQDVPIWQGKKAALTKNFNKYFDKLLLSDLEGVIKDSRITPELITKMSNDPDPSVRWDAIKHPDATSEHITKALDDSEPYVRFLAIGHPNATSEHITKALSDSHYDVRWQAIKRPNVTSEHITKALNDSNLDVRRTAIRHPKATSEQISKALNDPDSGVRTLAIDHPNATLEHISKALNDSDSWVRDAAKRKMM